MKPIVVGPEQIIAKQPEKIVAKQVAKQIVEPKNQNTMPTVSDAMTGPAEHGLLPNIGEKNGTVVGKGVEYGVSNVPRLSLAALKLLARCANTAIAKAALEGHRTWLKNNPHIRIGNRVKDNGDNANPIIPGTKTRPVVPGLECDINCRPFKIDAELSNDGRLVPMAPARSAFSNNDDFQNASNSYDAVIRTYSAEGLATLLTEMNAGDAKAVLPVFQALLAGFENPQIDSSFTEEKFKTEAAKQTDLAKSYLRKLDDQSRNTESEGSDPRTEAQPALAFVDGGISQLVELMNKNENRSVASHLRHSIEQDPQMKMAAQFLVAYHNQYVQRYDAPAATQKDFWELTILEAVKDAAPAQALIQSLQKELT